MLMSVWTDSISWACCLCRAVLLLLATLSCRSRDWMAAICVLTTVCDTNIRLKRNHGSQSHWPSIVRTSPSHPDTVVSLLDYSCCFKTLDMFSEAEHRLSRHADDTVTYLNLQSVLLLPHVLQLSSLLRLQPLDFTLQMTERHTRREKYCLTR